jgi:hypothetical protein
MAPCPVPPKGAFHDPHIYWGGTEPPKIRQIATSQLYYDCAMGLEVGDP